MLHALMLIFIAGKFIPRVIIRTEHVMNSINFLRNHLLLHIGVGTIFFNDGGNTDKKGKTICHI